MKTEIKKFKKNKLKKLQKRMFKEMGANFVMRDLHKQLRKARANWRKVKAATPLLLAGRWGKLRKVVLPRSPTSSPKHRKRKFSLKAMSPKAGDECVVLLCV